ncbi:MAG: hypothetical protein Q7T93_01470 [Methylobacterium sp.]|nr:MULTISPECIES: hypothetical protein [unclassified Methylobacterium]MDO9425483.1 hypothetical protein [Methylobacterium sp.]
MSAFIRARDWLLRNRRTGALTIGQWPNAPLSIFAICASADWALAPEGPAGTILRGVGTVALVVWAADELARGVNPLRRILGAGVLTVLAARWIVGAVG